MAILRGTPRADGLTGTPGADQLFGLGGDDTLIGLEGDDRFDGGTGNDTIRDEEGGVSTVVDLSGDTTVALTNAAAGSSITTGSGDDTIQLAQFGAFTTIVTGDGDDRVETEFFDGYTAERMDLGAGDDYAFYASGRVAAGPGDDRVVGSAGIDVVDGGAGNDDLDGSGGNPYATRFNGDGADTLIGNAGNDTLRSGSAISGDTLLGGAGDDTIVSGFYFRADGGPGDDVIGGGGEIAGGPGADTFLYPEGYPDQSYYVDDFIIGHYANLIRDFRPVLETVTVETERGPLEVSTFGAGGDAIDLDYIADGTLDDFVSVDPQTGGAVLNWRDRIDLQAGDFVQGLRFLIAGKDRYESFFEAVYLNTVPRDLDALGEALLIAGANIDLTAGA